MSDTAPARTAPLTLWKIAQAFLNTLYALFGGPEHIAFQHTHTRAERALFLPWLKAGEALMRRLLDIEASAYPKPNTRPRLWPKRTRVRRLVGFDDDKPEPWRVSFRSFSSPVHGGGVARRRDGVGDHTRPLPLAALGTSPASGGRKQAVRFYSAWPLAEHYESIIRVFNDPAPFEKRLAAHLHATPHRVRELLRLPERKRPRRSGEVADLPDLVSAERFAAIEAECGVSRAAFNSS